jgi:hypothetical protein
MNCAEGGANNVQQKLLGAKAGNSAEQPTKTPISWDVKPYEAYSAYTYGPCSSEAVVSGESWASLHRDLPAASPQGWQGKTLRETSSESSQTLSWLAVLLYHSAEPTKYQCMLTRGIQISSDMRRPRAAFRVS